MEQNISSLHRRGDHSDSDSESDPEREISGDDDDRNHKHRRREITSQSSELDAPQTFSSKPYNKRNKLFQNGNCFSENGSRMNGGWKNNTFAPSETEFLKHDRRHFDRPMFPRPQMDVNQRYGLAQTYLGDSGFAHGRGRNSWNAHAPVFGSMEFSKATKLYAGRGVSNVAGVRVHTAAWNPYSLLPGIPSGGLDAVHSMGINPSHRPPVNPPSTSGITRQKCRDFEERGFCLRGDMCPMEHGVNRIVVDDVQSLSQFNLPVSIPGGNGHGICGGSGPIPTGTSSASFSVNNTKIPRIMSKSKTARKGINSDAVGVFSNFSAAGNDFYDPDQPLLNKNGPELSKSCSSDIQLEKPAFGGDPSNENLDEIHNGLGIYPLPGSACGVTDTHNLMESSLGSVQGVASRLEPKGKVKIVPNRPGHNNTNILDKDERLNKNQTTSAQGIHVLSENKDTSHTTSMDASQQRLKGSSRDSKKPSQKAMRTIFVNGIPQKDNNIQALQSHFKKFGEIIDIYIPANGDRAFVQFFTREEAEAALKAPDAVMGNRFIKLWWANRDSIPDTGSSSGNNPYVNPFVGNTNSGPNPVSISSKGISNIPPASKASAATLAPSSTSKVNVVSSSQINGSDQGKHSISTGPVALAPSQTKLENLEVLKVELRKKQELLEQKRNELKRQLDKIEKQKQVAGVKLDSSSEHHAKRQKAAMIADVAKRTVPQPAVTRTSITLTEAEEAVQKEKPANKTLVYDPNTSSEPTTNLNVINLSLAETEDVLMNNSKLDKQPSSFKIVPLPSELSNIVTLREHFSVYGKVYDIELVNADSDECCTAIISFGTTLSAEKAFHSGKSLNGHDLQFAWVSGDIGEHDKISSAPEEPMDVDTSSENNVLQKKTVSQPDVDSEATEENIVDKVAVPYEKLTPHKELVEDQPSVNAEEEAYYSQPPEDDVMKNEEQLSEVGYAEKAVDEKSHNEESLKRLDYHDIDEDTEREYDKPHSGDESPRSYEERPPQIDADPMNEEHSIEEIEEKTYEEDQLSEDDAM